MVLTQRVAKCGLSTLQLRRVVFQGMRQMFNTGVQPTLQQSPQNRHCEIGETHHKYCSHNCIKKIWRLPYVRIKREQ